MGAALRKSGYAVDVSGDGEEGLYLARSNNYDVIVLDIMLPGIDGLAVLSRLRQDGKSTHVLLLTAKDTVEDRVTGLRSGADDYLVKPFALDELLARVEALARRSYGVKDPVIRIGQLEIDSTRRVARREGSPIDLRPQEFSLLQYLALRRGSVVTRDEIETHIYDELAEPMSNVVEVAVYRLRKKIDPPAGPSLIETRRGVGYLLR